MVIALEGADFSANNIGRIPIQKKFNQNTKDVFARFDIVEDTSNALQSAFDDFVSVLTENNMWGTKIKSLCLPFLSQITKDGSLEYAQMNIINGDNFFTSNIEGSLAMRNHGITPVDGMTAKKVNLSNLTGDNNYHLAGYNIDEENTTDVFTDGKRVARFIFGTMSAQLGVVKMYATAPYSPRLYTTSTSAVLGDTNYNSSSALIIGNTTIVDSAPTGNVSLSVNGQITSKSNVTLRGDSVSASVLFATYNKSTYKVTLDPDDTSLTKLNDYASKASWSVLSAGEALSDSECTIYTDAVNALMEVVRTM